MREGYSGFEKEIKGKSAAVVGMGISNMPLPTVLFKAGASKVRCFDKKYSESAAETVKNLKDKGFDIEYYGADDYLSAVGSGYDFVFRTPGLRPDTPELVSAGGIMTSEMEMFLKYCPCKVYGVTGSDGKTTTTTLISIFLQSAVKKTGGKVYCGGNIGTPLLEKLEMISENDRVCVELSSFQLIEMKIGTDVAVITNVSPNHLNYHLSYVEYLDSKANILKFRGKPGVCVLNRGNKDSERYMNACGEIRTFSVKCGPEKTGKCAFAQNGSIFYGENGKYEEIIKIKDILIKGDFNVENYMAAFCAAADETDIEDVRRTARAFGGVSHRMEFVREFEGVKYFNSSIDSSPNRTANALSVYDKKIVLIAGGKDKGISYDEIGPVICDKVKTMILTGPTAVLIEKAVRDEEKRRADGTFVETFFCKTYEEAVQKARESAKRGDNVVLSPASTSFDMFKNFEERGETFKRLVNELK